ncbi:hypothetical protein HDU77_011653 [Chytriomyces hyalinus]|nr:hypothetical protein HDU77_011653 [Chytriomyces hyalinus]
MNVSDTGPSSTTATAAAATSYWGNVRFAVDGTAYLKRQQDEGVTTDALIAPLLHPFMFVKLMFVESLVEHVAN